MKKENRNKERAGEPNRSKDKNTGRGREHWALRHWDHNKDRNSHITEVKALKSALSGICVDGRAEREHLRWKERMRVNRVKYSYDIFLKASTNTTHALMDVNTHTDEMFLFLWPVWVCAELRTITVQDRTEDMTEFIIQKINVLILMFASPKLRGSGSVLHFFILFNWLSHFNTFFSRIKKEEK